MEDKNNNFDLENKIVSSYMYDPKEKNDFLWDIPIKYRKKVFLGLYDNYCKFNKITNKYNRIEKLKYYENKIYTYKNQTLTDRQRVFLELYKIDKKISNSKFKNEKEVIYMFTLLVKLLEQDDRTVSSVMMYIKKKIVSLQLLLNMDVTFYNASYDYFTDTIRNVKNNHNDIKKKNR